MGMKQHLRRPFSRHTSSSRRQCRSKPRNGFWGFQLEALEDRLAPATVTWVNSAGGKWDQGSNWSSGAVPGATDDVIINTASAATIVIQSGDSESVHSVTTGANNTLSVTGGALTIGGNSTLSGALSMAGGSLTATGSGVNVTANGSTTVAAASLFAKNGATLSLPQLTSYTANATYFQADGTGSVLDVSALTTTTLTSSWNIQVTNSGTLRLAGLTGLGNSSKASVSVTDTGHSTLLDSNLTALDGVYATLDGTDAQVASSWAKFTNGHLTVTGGSYSLAGLTNVDGSSLSASKGGTLALPGLTSYAANQTIFSSNGAGSVLDVSALTTQKQAIFYPEWEIDAIQGGTVELTGMPSLSGPTSGNGGKGYLSITDTGGSSLVLSNSLSSLDRVLFTLDGTDSQVANSWASFTNGSLTITAGTYNLPGLTHIDGSSVVASGGASVSLPGVSSYSNNFGGAPALEATGAHTNVALTNLSTVTGSASLSLQALAGGTLTLSTLTQINTTGYYGLVQIESDGAGSSLDISSLATLAKSGAQNSILKVTDSGTLQNNSLKTLNFVSVYVDNTGIWSTAQFTSASNGTYTIVGFPPASGDALTINVPVLPQGLQGLAIQLGGFGGLGSYTGGTTINVPQNEIVNMSGGNFAGGTILNVASGASLSVSGARFSGGETFSFGQNDNITIGDNTFADGTTFTAAANTKMALAASFGLNFTGGITFNFDQGVIANVSGPVTSSGLMTFNLAQGAAVNLNGDNVINNPSIFSGVMTGSGLGTVNYTASAGPFVGIGIGGLTLNFPAGMFQWTGGPISSSFGDLTNRGTLNLTGSKAKTFAFEGTLDNFGTIIQSGTGNLVLNSDHPGPATFKNEAGATYVIQSDSGFSSAGHAVVFNNAGTVRKTGGTGTTVLNIQGPLNNAGTIEAASGTLFLDASSISQVSSNTLTAGTWNAVNGATLQLPSGTNITTNQSSIALGGNGATIAAIAGLSSNGGPFTVTDGASFATTADFSNSGNLSVGDGSTFSVKGNYSQTIAGTFTVQVGGTPSSGQFGRVAVQGVANLGGTLSVNLASGFTPSNNAVYPVMTFASSTGAFSSATGLSPYFSQQLGPTALNLKASSGTLADLALSAVTAPTSAKAGEPIAVNWQVTNNGGKAATGTWQDSVYLSTTSAITPSSILLGSVAHSGGLAAGSSYNGSLTAAVPALPPGSYVVLVQADSLYQVPESERANDILNAATGPLAVSVPALSLGTPAQGAFTAADQDRYFQVVVPAGGALSIALQSAASSGALALYVSEGAPPTPYSSQWAAVAPNQANQAITVPQVFTAGTYYILVHSISGPAASAGFTLTATQTSALAINAISPSSAGNGGSATVEIDGSNFLATAAASLTLASATIHASSIHLVNASQIFATFDLTGAATGSYALTVQQGAATATTATPFQVVPASTTNPLRLTLNTPSLVRPGRVAVLTATASNTGNVDLPAPLLVLSTAGGNLYLPWSPAFQTSSLTFLATSPTGPAGILAPGESVTVTIDFESTTTTTTEIGFQLHQVDGSLPFDWSQIASLLPQNDASLPNAAAALTFLENEVGSTWGGYLAMLDRNASLIPPQLGRPDDFKALFTIEFEKALAAVNTSISGSLQSTQPGVSISGRTVHATDTATGTVYRTTTLNDGSFVFPVLPASSYAFGVDGLLLTSPPTVTLKAGQALTGVALTATRGAEIMGQVLASSAPIEGGTIRAANEVSLQAFGVSADANGNYDLIGLPAGIYDLVVNAKGYAQAVIPGVDVSQGNVNKNVTLSAPSSISGSISLGSGGPAQGTLAVIASISGSRDANQAFATSSSSTSFTLNGLPAETYEVTLRLAGYITQTISGVVVAAGQNVGLGTIALAPASEIDGTVTSTDPNQPAGETAIEALQGGTVVATTITDLSGDFQLTNLSPGTYTLAVPSAAFATAPTVTVGLGQTLTGQSVLVQPGGTIAGTVSDQNAHPLPGMPVYLSGPNGLSRTVTTAGDGSYRFNGLAAGSYDVSLLVGGPNAVQRISITSLNGAATANLRMAYAATVTGALTDSSANRITDGVVTLYQNGKPIANASTNGAGVYTFLVIQLGTFDLAATASEGTFPAATGIVVGAGEIVTQNFQAGSGSLTIAVSDGASPAAGDSVVLETLVDGSLKVVQQTSVGDDDTASFVDLAAANYTVTVTSSEGHSGQTTTSVATGAPTSIDISLVAAASVSGTITDGAGHALSGATVLMQLASDSRKGSSAITAADGTYSITALPPGSYDVTVFADGYLADTQTGITVTTTATVNAALAASTTTIQGELVDSTGNPVPGGLATITDAAGHILGAASVNPDGSFTISSAQGSNLVLQAGAQGYSPASPLSFSAAAGGTTQLSPVVLQAVALDPSSANQGGSQQPQSIDGQAWADDIDRQARQLQAFPIAGTVPPPSCPQCMPAYNAVLAAQRAVADAVKPVDDMQTTVKLQAFNVTSTAAAEVTGIYGELALTLAPTILTARLAFKAPIWLGTLGVRISSILKIIDQIGQFDALRDDAAKLMSATSLSSIKEIAEKGKQDAQKLHELLRDAIASLNINVSALPDDAPAKAWIPRIMTNLRAALQAMEKALLEDPFARTVTEATKLQNEFDVLKQRYSEWKNALARFQDAVTALSVCEAQPCQPDPPDNSAASSAASASGSSNNRVSGDPNALIGPAGYGPQGFIPRKAGVLPYTIDFENHGSVAAQDVTVTEQLDPNLDWSTFQLGSFGFGSVNIVIPTGLTQYQTKVAYQNVDGSALSVHVALDFNVQTGLLTVTFASLDPATGLAPTGVTDGFLPPNNNNHVGEGYMQYTVQANGGLTTGASIKGGASIVFDTNAPLATNSALNTIDSGAPTSNVNPLPVTTNSPSFTVSWSGTDDAGGSGIASYTVYVSVNGAAFTPWLTNQTQTSATYTGVIGNTYSFYSVATDNVGLQQPLPTGAQATTKLVPPLRASASTLVAIPINGSDELFAITANNGLYFYRSAVGWQQIGAAGTVQSISGVAAGAGNLVLFVVTTDAGLFRYSPTSGWAQIGGSGTIRSISAGTDAKGQADVFVLTTGNAFFEYSQVGWAAVGAANTILAMSAASQGRVVVVTADHSVFQFGPSTGWIRLTSAGFAKSLSVVTEGAGNLAVFAVTQNNALYRETLTSGWQAIGAAGTIQAVDAGTDAHGKATVFALTADDSFFRYNSAEWTPLGAPHTVLGMEAADSDRVFAITADGSLFANDDTFGWYRLTGSGFISG